MDPTFYYFNSGIALVAPLLAFTGSLADQNASATLAAMTCTVLALASTVDGEHRIRGDRIDKEKHAIWKARDRAFGAVYSGVQEMVSGLAQKIRGPWSNGVDKHGERQALLDGNTGTSR